jgi:hypothetical protein
MGSLCSRSGCGAAAVATFSFDGSACVVWIDRFPGSGNGAGLLCARHADTLTPPRHWQLQDRRGPAPALWTERPAVPAGTRPRRARRVPAPQEATDPPSLPFDPATAAPDGVERVPFSAASELERLLGARTPLLARAFESARR